MHQHHNVVNTSLLERMLASPDFHARAAAVARARATGATACPNSLDLLAQGRRRRASARAAGGGAGGQLLHRARSGRDSADRRRAADRHLHRLRPRRDDEDARSAMSRKRSPAASKIAFATDAGARYFLRNLSTEQLLKEARTRPVFLEMLYRPGLQDEQRREAVARSGQARQEERAGRRDGRDQGARRQGDERQRERRVRSGAAAHRPPGQRAGHRPRRARKAGHQRQAADLPADRLCVADQRRWQHSTRPGRWPPPDAKSLQDFVERHAADLRSQPCGRRCTTRSSRCWTGCRRRWRRRGGKGTLGRYVRIELPGRGTLTLAEVEVTSGGANVARQGRASQKNTANGGDASRAIDGNKSGSLRRRRPDAHRGEHGPALLGGRSGRGTCRSTQIVIYNRTDGDLGKRLERLHAARCSTTAAAKSFKQQDIPAPAQERHVRAVRRRPGGDHSPRGDDRPDPRPRQGSRRRSAAGQVRRTDDADRLAAIRALQRIPRDLLGQRTRPGRCSTRSSPTSRRRPSPTARRPAALDALEFADALVSAACRPTRPSRRGPSWRELGVRVIRLGTVFEKMSYDKDVIVVQAGKPVEFVLENTDLMPHNFVIVQPGSLEEIGLLAEASAQQPEFAVRQFVPQFAQGAGSPASCCSRAISQQLSFTAPTRAGRLSLRLHVSRPLAADVRRAVRRRRPRRVPGQPRGVPGRPTRCRSRTTCSKDRRPRTEWKFDDLAAGARPS